MASYTGIIFAVAAMVFWGFEEFFLKKAITGIKSITTYLINSVVGVLVQFLIIGYFFNFEITNISGQNLFLALAAVILSFVGYFALYLALEKQSLSLISSIDGSWIVVSIFISVLFLGDTLNGLHILLILGILLGTFLVSTEALKSFKKIRFIAGSGYELISVICIGLTIPIEQVLVSRIGEANALFYLAVPIIPVVLIGRFIIGKKFVWPSWRHFKLSAYSGLADGFAFAFYIMAIKEGNISVISPIVASNVLVSVILARIFLREKMTARQSFGASLILLSIIILSIKFSF